MLKADFEKRFNTQVSYAHMIDSVIATKAIAQCGNPPFTVPSLLNAEAVMLAEGGCLQDYDLGVVANYKDLLPGTFESPRAGLKSYWAAHTMIDLLSSGQLTYHQHGGVTSFDTPLAAIKRG